MDKQFTVLEIIENMVGSIRPIGESNEDDRRFENLKIMCELTDSLISKIDEVSFDYRNRMEFSMKRASDYAKEFLTEKIGIQK